MQFNNYMVWSGEPKARHGPVHVTLGSAYCVQPQRRGEERKGKSDSLTMGNGTLMYIWKS